MLTFIVGATGTGKSTMAAKLAERDGRRVVSAGGWVREATGIWGHGPEEAERLSEASTAALKADPLVAARWLEAKLGADRRAIVEGIRNPTDLLHLARPGDHVLDLGGLGVTSWERDGLAAVRGCRAFLARSGVTWSEHRRHLAALPEPLAAHVLASRLRGDDGTPGVEAGRIVALESYQGSPVTACWVSDAGGSFHDLPLEAFVVEGHGMESAADAAELFRSHPFPGAQCYSAAGAGSPVVEAPPIHVAASVFDRERRKVGVGRPLWIMHWPDDNLLLHLVAFGGRLLLWPPHKLMWRADAAELPDWKKKRS